MYSSNRKNSEPNSRDAKTNLKSVIIITLILLFLAACAFIVIVKFDYLVNLFTK